MTGVPIDPPHELPRDLHRDPHRPVPARDPHRDVPVRDPHRAAAHHPHRAVPARDLPHRVLDLDLDPAAVPRDWCAGDAYATSLMAGLSMVFPVGERFFVDSVKQVRDRIADPALRAQIAGFVAQEAMHGKGHRDFNRLLVAHGDAAAPAIEARIRALLALGRRLFAPSSQLAITSALEHLTAILAERLLADPAFRDQLDPRVRGLWLWHALEEIEHKAVAFDAFRAVGGGEVRRLALMVLATTIFFAAMAAIQAVLLHQRGALTRPWRLARGVARLWLWPGPFARMIPRYLAYYRPGFHPDHHDTHALVATWRERLFGAAGELHGQLRSA